MSDYDNMDAGFKAGTTMCILQGPWQVADILKGSAFSDKTNLVIAPVPVAATARRARPSAATTRSSALRRQGRGQAGRRGSTSSTT